MATEVFPWFNSHHVDHYMSNASRVRHLLTQLSLRSTRHSDLICVQEPHQPNVTASSASHHWGTSEILALCKPKGWNEELWRVIGDLLSRFDWSEKCGRFIGCFLLSLLESSEHSEGKVICECRIQPEETTLNRVRNSEVTSASNRCSSFYQFRSHSELPVNSRASVISWKSQQTDWPV
jgi:hypothetical protein